MVGSAKPSNEDKTPSRLKLIQALGYALASVLVAVLLSGIQGNRASINQLEEQVDRLENDFLGRLDKIETGIEGDAAALEASVAAEIARLDESNRNRRNQIAALEVATAANATALDELRRDIERILPPGTDSP